jgi:hypothetical protein
LAPREKKLNLDMALRVPLRSLGTALERLERRYRGAAAARGPLNNNAKRRQPLSSDAQLAVAPLLCEDAASVTDIDLPLKSTPSEPQ